jgi:predicted Zn-dependent protease with MMP-like domain
MWPAGRGLRTPGLQGKHIFSFRFIWIGTLDFNERTNEKSGTGENAVAVYKMTIITYTNEDIGDLGITVITIIIM